MARIPSSRLLPRVVGKSGPIGGCKPKPPKIPSGSSGCLETLAIEHGTNPIFQSEIPELPGRCRCRLNPGEVGPFGALSDPARRTQSDPANVFFQRSQWPIASLRALPSAWPVDCEHYSCCPL